MRLCVAIFGYALLCNSAYSRIYDGGEEPVAPKLVSKNPSAFCKDSGCPSGQKCILNHCVLDIRCEPDSKYGNGPPNSCDQPTDPNNLSPSELEAWFTKEIFEDLFPKANLGWGPNSCWPYSYDAFVIAARYFPEFGTESPDNGYTKEENNRRDLSAFFSHAIQETGENHPGAYKNFPTQEEGDACFYRGGFFNWFEGGPTSSFLEPESRGWDPRDGDKCNQNGRYCSESPTLDHFFPCNKEEDDNTENKFKYSGCYFGRGAIQISYNYNYGQFNEWLKTKRIDADLLRNPNLVMTKMDPPLAVMASLWFHMTPQPPKPAMHDIVLGNWEPGAENRAAGYQGPIFGPTSLIINNECGGEDPETPGGPGESRRIKAFKWFTRYFNAPLEEEGLLTCKGMPVKLESIEHNLSYQPEWSTTWKEQACNCAPASYGGLIPYFQEGFYPEKFGDMNEANRQRCVVTMYERPDLYTMDPETSPCLNHGPNGKNDTRTTGGPPSKGFSIDYVTLATDLDNSVRS